MKRIIYSLIIGCTLLAACKKDHSDGPNPTDKTPHNVVLSVGFSQQTAQFNLNNTNGNHFITNGLTTNSADTTVTNHISVLVYAVYNSTGTFVHQVTQKSTGSGFGTYTDKLLPGTYTIVIGGGGPGLVITAGNNPNSAPSQFSTDALSYGANSNWVLFQYDTFFKKITLTVSNTDQTQSVALNRITNPVQIVIKDAIPANVKALNFYIAGAANEYVMSTGTGLGTTDGDYTTYKLQVPVKAADIGKTNFTLTQMLLYQSPLTVTLYASSTLDSGTGDIAQKVIPNVTCLPNAETILSGNLFGGAAGGGGGFSLHIDTAYTGTPIIKTFP